MEDKISVGETISFISEGLFAIGKVVKKCSGYCRVWIDDPYTGLKPGLTIHWDVYYHNSSLK